MKLLQDPSRTAEIATEIADIVVADYGNLPLEIGRENTLFQVTIET